MKTKTIILCGESDENTVKPKSKLKIRKMDKTYPVKLLYDLFMQSNN